MKLRRTLAAVAALAVAATTTVTSFAAAKMPEGTNQSSGMFTCLRADDGTPTDLKNTDLAHTITSFSLTLKCKDKDFEAEVAEGLTWYGGAVGFNSNSTGWKSVEWSIQDGVKPLTLKATDTRYEYIISYSQDTPIFTESDEYCQLWIQDWTGTYDFSLVSYEILNADGVDVRTLDSEVPAEEPEAPAEEPEAPAEEPEEPAEEPEAPAEEPEEPAEEPEEPAEEPEEPAEEPEEPAEEPEAPATTPDASKGSPDTGVEGIVAVTAIAALAGAAVVASRKRK